jgi:hypothetical protein
VSAYRQIADSIDIRGGLALWVLTAHSWALLLPLLLIAVVTANADYVAANTDYGWVFYIVAGVMMAGSAFEIAQNTIDRWYLTPDCASAKGKSFCDLLFFWFIVASQGLVIFACFGSNLWLSIPILLLVLVYPWFYLRSKLDMVPLAVLGLGSVAAMWFSFGDPLVFLQLLISPLVGVFFAALLRSGAQFLHGFVTLLASSNGLFTAWVIHSAADGEPTPWTTVAVAAVLMIALLLAVPRATKNLTTTPRPASHTGTRAE